MAKANQQKPKIVSSITHLRFGCSEFETFKEYGQVFERNSLLKRFLVVETYHDSRKVEPGKAYIVKASRLILSMYLYVIILGVDFHSKNCSQGPLQFLKPVNCLWI